MATWNAETQQDKGKGSRLPALEGPPRIFLEADWPPGSVGVPQGVVLLHVRSPEDARRVLRLLGAERHVQARTSRRLEMLRHAGLLDDPVPASG